MNNLAYAMGQCPPGVAGQPAASPLAGFIPIIIIFFIFYMLLIRPQQKQQKQHQQMLAQLKKNDEVVTSGGIYGTIVNVEDQTVTLRIDDNARIKLQKSAIACLKKKG